MAVEENSFEKLLKIPNNPEIDKHIARGFEERQRQRSYFYDKKAKSQENFDFYREYAIGNQSSKKPVSKLVFLFYVIL